jgi:hypothetical protein
VTAVTLKDFKCKCQRRSQSAATGIRPRGGGKKTAERTVALRKIIYNSLSDQHKTSAGGETDIPAAGKPKKERQHHGC